MPYRAAFPAPEGAAESALTRTPGPWRVPCSQTEKHRQPMRGAVIVLGLTMAVIRTYTI
jgi:hypothetical protein